MVLQLVIILLIGIFLEKFLFHRIALNKYIITIVVGIAIIAFNIFLYLSLREPNLYEQLGIGRMMQIKEVLRLIKRNPNLSSYYEDVQKGVYELRCVNQSPDMWLSESFHFYGGWILAINFISFTNSSISRTLLVFLLLNLGIEFMIYAKTITLSMIIYTSCEQIHILRAIFPGLALIIYLASYVRYSNMILARKLFNDQISSMNEDTAQFKKHMEKNGLHDYFDLLAFIDKLIDSEVKKNIQPSKLKKVAKYIAVAVVLYSIINKTGEGIEIIV